MKKVWTKSMITKLRNEYPKADIKHLSHQLGVTCLAIKAKAKLLGLRRDAYLFWSKENERSLIELYPYHTNKHIAEIFQMTESAISARAFKLKLYKSKEFHVRSRKATQFQKGGIPLNKGKAWNDFMWSI